MAQAGTTRKPGTPSKAGIVTTDFPPLIDRVREALEPDGPLREVRMFGGISFMVNGKMVVAARNNKDLLVRVDPSRNAELLARPGATQAMMGAGRTMGPSWVSVAPEALASDEQLAYWLDVALEYNRRVKSR